MITIVAGATGAAVIKAIDGIIQWFLQRKAKKEDDDIAGMKTTDEKIKQRIDSIDTELLVIKHGIMSMMLDRLQSLCKKYIKDGEVDVDDRRRLRIMHQNYHDLDGNGDLDLLMKAVDELPIKHEREDN